MKKIVTLAVLAMGAILSANAEINVGYSLDWLVVSSPHIAVVDKTGTKPAERLVEGRTKSALKGSPPPNSSFDYYMPSDAKIGNEFLVFWDANREFRYAIDLEQPPTSSLSAAYTNDFKLYHGRDEILNAVKARLNHSQSGQIQVDTSDRYRPKKGAICLDVPDNSEAWKIMFDGSACFLWIPADPELKAGIMKQIAGAKDPMTKAGFIKQLYLVHRR